MALPLGAITATIVFLLFNDTGTSPGIGPVDVLGFIFVFAATVIVALPRAVVRQRRASRTLAVWCVLMFGLMLAESARQCSSSDIRCHGGGDPLRTFFVWAVGFVVLAGVWYLTDPRRRHRRRRRFRQPRRAQRGPR